MRGKMQEASRAMLLDMGPEERSYWQGMIEQVENGCLLSRERSFFSMMD